MIPLVLIIDLMEKDIIQYLKIRAKSLGITQGALAKGLGVSLPTVKRWYSGKGITIPNLKALCDYLGCSMSEVITSVEAPATKSFTYSLQQEEALAKEPRLLAFFDHLVRGKSVSSIKAKFQLSEVKVTSLLLKLDKLGLLEVHPNNRVRLKSKGEPSWLPHGPLAQHFRHHILKDFIGRQEKDHTPLYLHDYLDEDLVVIKERLRDLEQFLKISNMRAFKSSKPSQSYGAYFALKKYQWSLDKYLEERPRENLS